MRPELLFREAVPRGGAPACPGVNVPAFPARHSIFEQDWWLTAAGQGRIQRVEVRWGGAFVGALSYHRTRHLGFERLHMPPYTRRMGPRLTAPESGPATQVRNLARLIQELHAALPPCDSFRAVISAGPELMLAYHLNGFALEPKFTFLSPREVSVSEAVTGLHQKVRNLVKSGREAFETEEHLDFDRFRRLSGNRRAADGNDYPALASIFAAVRVHRAGTVLTVVGPGSNDLAAALLVWDAERLYFLVSARAQGAEGNKAYALLFLESLALAKRMNLDFDADGFADLARARPLARWGLPVSVDVEVSRESLLFQGLRRIRRRLQSSSAQI